MILPLRCESRPDGIFGKDRGEAHLRQVLKAYTAYYNATRTHLGIDKDAPNRSWRAGARTRDGATGHYRAHKPRLGRDGAEIGGYRGTDDRRGLSPHRLGGAHGGGCRHDPGGDCPQGRL